MNKRIIISTLSTFGILGSVIIGLSNSFKTQEISFNIKSKEAKKPNVERVLEVKKIDEVSLEDIQKIKNFLPKDSYKNEVKTEKIKFIKIVKKIDLKKITINQQDKISVDKNNRDFKEIDLSELDYSEISQQKEITHTINKRNDWSSLALNLDEYSNVENKVIVAEEKIKKTNIIRERISKKIESTDSENTTDENELVFFDYGKKEEKVVDVEKTTKLDTQKVFSDKQKISKLVAINKVENSNSTQTSIVTQSQNIGNTIDKDFDSRKIDESIQDIVNSKMSASSQSNPNIVKAKKEVMGFLSSEENTSQAEIPSECYEKENSNRIYNAEYSISFLPVGKKIEKTVYNFELRFQDNIDDIIADNGSGKVQLKTKMSSQKSVRRALVLASDYYPMSTDILLENGSYEVKLPLFRTNFIESIIQNYKLRGLGAHLMIELANETEEVDLDIKYKYERKIYLNSQFSAVDKSDSDYNYILFVGIESGNTIVNYIDSEGNTTSRIIHLTEREIFYDQNINDKITKEEIRFFQEGLINKCKSQLNIAQNNISSWNYNAATFTKKNHYSFDILNMNYSKNSNKYLKLDHLGESIFVGRWDKKNIVIPDEEYIDFVIRNMDIAQDKCLVQLNLEKEAESIYINGISENSGMRTIVKMLDKDGRFYNQLGSKTEKIFMKGDEQGLLNIAIEYIDGSSDYLQTYCSENTYLIEQL